VTDSKKKKLTESLDKVMHRFQDFFLGVGLNVGEKNVALRERDDFAAPLVTVFGHTYGVRLTDDTPFAIEASANVYDDEFSLDRFRTKLLTTYELSNLDPIVQNFHLPEEDGDLFTETKELADLFQPLSPSAIDLRQKKKENPSKITGRLEDSVLSVRFDLTDEARKRFEADEPYFRSAVYLYCLRPFAAAYHQSLRIDPHA